MTTWAGFWVGCGLVAIAFGLADMAQAWRETMKVKLDIERNNAEGWLS